MIACLMDRQVPPTTAVMGDVLFDGSLYDLPPFNLQHLQDFVKMGVRRLFVPMGNAEEIQRLPGFDPEVLEVVPMSSLKDHVLDILFTGVGDENILSLLPDPEGVAYPYADETEAGESYAYAYDGQGLDGLDLLADC